MKHLLILTACLLLGPDGSNAAGSFTFLSRSLIEGPARTVCFFDRGIILAAGAGIAVFAGTDSLDNPAFVPIQGKPHEIAIKGDVAYLAAFEWGLVAVDLSNPCRPVQVFSYRAPKVMHCTVSGNTLHLSGSGGELYRFDVADPLKPILQVTGGNWGGVPLSFAVEHDILCVVYEKRCTVNRVLSGSGDGSAPEQLAEIKPPFPVSKGIMGDRILYLLSSSGGTAASWDLADPRNPVFLGQLEIGGIVDIAPGQGGGVLLRESCTIVPFEVARRGGQEGRGRAARFTFGKPMDACELTSRALSREREGDTGSVDRQPRAVALSGNRCALVSPWDGLSLLSLDRSGPRFLDRFETRGFAVNLVASGNLLYVANSFDGVRIGEVRENGTVDWMGHLVTAEARDVALAGNHLIIADGKSGLKIADVSDPRHPRIVGRCEASYPERLIEGVATMAGKRYESYLCALVVRGTRAYCASGLAGVEIIDVSDPRHPRRVWREHFSEVRGIDADDRCLYFADGYAGFRIFSLDGQRPSSLSVLDTRGWNCDCAIVGNTAYLANGGSGVIAADVSDRRNPKILSTIHLGSIVREVFVLDTTLYVANERAGIASIDISDQRSLSLSARFQTVDDARGIFADDRFVYCANGEGGVCIFAYDE